MAEEKNLQDEKNLSTRKEILKKINAELEKLDDKQLDQVAGGLGDIWDMFKSIKN